MQSMTNKHSIESQKFLYEVGLSIYKSSSENLQGLKDLKDSPHIDTDEKKQKLEEIIKGQQREVNKQKRELEI